MPTITQQYTTMDPVMAKYSEAVAESSWEPTLLSGLVSEAEVRAAVQAIVRTSSSFESVHALVWAMASPKAHVRQIAFEQQLRMHERLGAPFARIAMQAGVAKAWARGLSLELD